MYVIYSHATNQPGIAIPHVTSVAVDSTFKYLILASEGVYRTLDSGNRNKSGNDIIVEMIEEHVTKKGWKNVAINILQEICQTQWLVSDIG